MTMKVRIKNMVGTNKKDATKYAVCRLKIVGGVEDSMISVETGCTDGNGKRDIAVINTDNVREIITE